MEWIHGASHWARVRENGLRQLEIAEGFEPDVRWTDMKRVILLIASFVFFAASAAPDYENPGTVQVSGILKPETLRGSDYQIANEASSDGYTYFFTIDSKFGIFQARGKTHLAIRVQEVEAIAQLKKVTSSEAFAQAAGKAAMKPIESTVNVVTNPVDTAKGIPGGVKRKFENLGRFAKKMTNNEENDPETEEGKTESQNAAESTAKAVLGVNAAHRQWAQKVGADPYSSNAVLQNELNRLAKYDATGRLGTNVLRPKIPEMEKATRINDLVWAKDPFELRKLNEQRLKEMGIDQKLSAQFLDSKILTPSQQTYIVSSLQSLSQTQNRAEFIRVTLSAVSKEEALLYRDSAAILEKMQKAGTEINAFVPNARIAVVRSGKRFIAVLPADRLFWTQSFAKALEAFLQRFQKELQNSTSRELWLSGDATPQVRSELARHKWTIRENLL